MWQPAAGRLIGLAVVLVALSGALSGPLSGPLGDQLSAPLGADPSADPSPTPSPTGAVVPTPPVTPTAEPVPTLPVTPTPTPTPARSASPTPTATPTATATVVAVPAVPPAIATSAISPTALFIAVGVLLAGAIFLWWLVRRRPPSAPAMPPTAQPVPTPVLLDSMATLGTAMIDSGYPVGLIHDALGDLATASGRPTVQAVVFPTSILVSAADDDGAQTRAVAAGESSYLLYQIDMVDHIVAVARRRPGAAPWVGRQAARVADAPPPFSRAQRIGASGLLSAALSVLLGASWLGVLVAGVLGVAVGVVLLTTERVAAGSQALVVVSVSLGVALAVLLVAHTVDPGVLPAMVAPLVILLPGGLLTIAVIELATGQIMSGAARAAAGAMRLLLLATGIVAASALIGIPARDPLQLNPLGPVAPWIAVAVFGIGITVYQCARRSSVGWILVVLYVAYGAQVVADVFFDGVLSALVGAAVMTPVAVVIARERTGPPAIASFLPAFWLLVPGALGLVGVAGVLEGDLDATSTIITTVATMIAIALGVLVGLAIAGTLCGSASGDDPVDADELIRGSDAGA
ncbi:threonine/serine exporter family protein [Microbacterium sp. W1N]|uniref:threonine/serine exporter family protein n=1 Tax=Microbacterium festucae TaxID=2977531 RepID=UPI0021BEA141|nr:threonine/serine exporter family protein [Microbacterium festucae]MCT9821079.1 threonine/serine exporter family protein [Microbacterium festucae]